MSILSINLCDSMPAYWRRWYGSNRKIDWDKWKVVKRKWEFG